MNPFRCDGCGRFISYDALDKGEAMHWMTLPDSDYTIETWATECGVCREKETSMAEDIAMLDENEAERANK